jgi:hypothetical protein
MKNILVALVFTSLIPSVVWGRDMARLPLIEFHQDLVSCQYADTPVEFKKQIQGLKKGKRRELEGDLAALLGTYGVKSHAELIDVITAQDHPVEIKGVSFENVEDEGCSAPAHLRFHYVFLDAKEKEVDEGFVKPDWLTPVADIAKEYPGAWRRWQAYLPELRKEIDAYGGFQLDASPDFRKADEDRIEHPALIFKDRRVKAADGGIVFIIASHYFPKQIYLNASGEFQDFNSNDCVAICED